MKKANRIAFAVLTVICAAATVALTAKLVKEGGFPNFLFVCCGTIITAVCYISSDENK